MMVKKPKAGKPAIGYHLDGVEDYHLDEIEAERKPRVPAFTMTLRCDGVAYRCDLTSDGDVELIVDDQEPVYLDANTANVLGCWLCMAADEAQNKRGL